MAEEIKFIVQSLNKAPFNMRLSLVSLDSKSDMELLQVVNDIFSYLDPKQYRKDVRDEDVGTMAARMLEFAVVLKYKTAAEIDVFSQKFIKSDKGAIYPFMAWMLSRLPELKKRAYLARFLRPPVIPEDMFADDQVVSLIQQLKSGQDEFKELHKELDQARKTHTPPTELERDIRQLETEMEQLDNKLDRLRHRVTSHPELKSLDFDEILHATHALRKEQEEEASLSKQMRDQRMRLDKAVNNRRASNIKLKELQDSDGKVDPSMILQKQREETIKLRMRYEKFDRDIRERDKTYREITKTLTSAPLSFDMVEQLQQECEALHQHVEMLVAQRDIDNRDSGDQINMCRTRLNGIESKRDKLTERMEELDDEKKELLGELSKIDKELKSLSGDSKRPMTDSELAIYTTELKGRMDQLKQLKAQLKHVQNEVGILQSTERILRSRDEKIEEITAELERERGIEGYSAMQSNLDQLSLQQSDLNLAKGATLDQISKMVDQITNSIKAKRGLLQPLIKQLKTVRQEYDEVDLEYSRKHKQYESVASALRAERQTLEEEFNKYVSDINNDEASMHQLRSMIQISNARLEQARNEEMYVMGRGKLNREFRTFQDRLEKVVDEEARLQKQLQDEQRHIQASHQGQVGQRKLFTSLKALLLAKLNSSKGNTGGSGSNMRMSNNNLGEITEGNEDEED